MIKSICTALVSVTLLSAMPVPVSANSDFLETLHAAERGDADAQTSVGFMYDLGVGVQQNKSKAIEWYTKSAGQGERTAQFNLGLMYFIGDGVGQDRQTAKGWFCMACEQGDQEGCMFSEHLNKQR